MKLESAFRLGLLPSVLVARFAAARLRGRDGVVDDDTIRELMAVTLLTAELPGPPPMRPRDHTGAIAWARDISQRAMAATAASTEQTAALLLGLAVGDLIHSVELHALVHELRAAGAEALDEHDRSLTAAEDTARKVFALAAQNPSLPPAVKPVLFRLIAVVRTLDHQAPRAAVLRHVRELLGPLSDALTPPAASDRTS